MNRRISIATVFALMLLVAAVTFTLTYTEMRNSVNRQLAADEQQQEELSKYLEVKSYIEEYYVGQYDEQQLMDASLSGLIAGLGDQWSHYLTRDQYQQYLQSAENEYVGVGLTAHLSEDQKSLVISEVISGSPAEEAGLQVMELIVAVDGKSVSELGYNMTVSNIRGEEGTDVTLEIEGLNGQRRNVLITRRKVQQEAVHAEIFEDDIGYVRISNFDAGVSADFEQAVKKLIEAGVKGLIFDVRLNPGGRLQELVPMLDMLLPGGRIFSSTDKNGVEDNYDSDAAEVALPMAVIINQYSYSAAEFFAAALQEYDKAELVGQATTGKGYAQVPIELDDGSALILSVTEYFTPKGESLADKGVSPDYTVEMSDQELMGFPNIDHANDKQFIKAVSVVRQEAAQLEAQAAAQTE